MFWSLFVFVGEGLPFWSPSGSVRISPSSKPAPESQFVWLRLGPAENDDATERDFMPNSTVCIRVYKAGQFESLRYDSPLWILK